MRKIAEFTRDAELNRRILEFQEAAVASVDELTKRALLRRRSVDASAVVRPGELVVLTTNASLMLTPVLPGKEHELQELWIIKRFSAGTITVRPIQTTVNGGTSISISSVGLTRLLVEDGRYWH